MVNKYCGVDVPMPIQLFKKMEFERVEVAKSEPTVSCDDVAMRAVPAAFDVMIEFGEKEVAPVPP